MPQFPRITPNFKKAKYQNTTSDIDFHKVNFFTMGIIIKKTTPKTKTK